MRNETKMETGGTATNLNQAASTNESTWDDYLEDMNEIEQRFDNSSTQIKIDVSAVFQPTDDMLLLSLLSS